MVDKKLLISGSHMSHDPHRKIFVLAAGLQAGVLVTGVQVKSRDARGMLAPGVCSSTAAVVDRFDVSGDAFREIAQFIRVIGEL